MLWVKSANHRAIVSPIDAIYFQVQLFSTKGNDERRDCTVNCIHVLIIPSSSVRTHCIPCMNSKSAFTVFSHTTFIHFWQQQQWPWRALSARQKKKKNHSNKRSRSDAAVLLRSRDFHLIWTFNMCSSSSSDTHLKHHDQFFRLF